MDRYTQNLHTHTKYCDGKNTPREMIEKAIELGFDTLGFSGHSNTKFDITWHMTEENVAAYRKEITELKEEYKGRIDILLGLEYDIYSDTPFDGYDYTIGSCHFMKVPGDCVSFDEPAATARSIIDNYFGGDGMKYACQYYNQMAELSKYGKFDIVGHFDIVAKHCEKENFFDIDSKTYQNAALTALHAISETHKVFEINTGAIARGYRTTPYPAPFILKEMKTLGCIPIITADCHNRDFLNCSYDDALEYIKSCGFTEIGVMKNGVICQEKI